MPGETAPDRRLVVLTGTDALPFLQGLVTNDVLALVNGPGLVWTALLTPQGKYLADFFVANTGEALLLDLPEPIADATLRRLSMYRLRADVTLTPTDTAVSRGTGTPPSGTPPSGTLPDPRHPALGWRRYGAAGGPPIIDWDAIRVTHTIPETGIELTPDTFILEAGFERLRGVDFRKGCYVGQEVTARMKHKTELRKGIVRVEVTGSAPVGTEILSDGKPAGQLYTQSGGHALAYLRHDRATGAMQAGDAIVTLA
ncbi:MAG: YgfZ/GcvT domain-containing protein [Paracoccaceae bacterium]